MLVMKIIFAVVVALGIWTVLRSLVRAWAANCGQTSRAWLGQTSWMLFKLVGIIGGTLGVFILGGMYMLVVNNNAGIRQRWAEAQSSQTWYFTSAGSNNRTFVAVQVHPRSEPQNDAKVNAYALDQFATTNAIKNQGFTRVCVVKHAMSAGEIIPTPDKMLCEEIR